MPDLLDRITVKESSSVDMLDRISIDKSMSPLEAARIALSDEPIPERRGPSEVIGQVRVKRPIPIPNIPMAFGGRMPTKEEFDVPRFGKQLANRMILDTIEAWRPSSLYAKGSRIAAQRYKNFRELGGQWEDLS